MGPLVAEFLEIAVSFVWGPALLTLLLGGGSYLALISRFRPLLGWKRGLELLTSNRASAEGSGGGGEL